MKVWNWEIPTNGTLRDIALVASGAGAVALGELLWGRRNEIQRSLQGVRRPPADISEAETIARNYLTQMGVASPTMTGSHFDGETWTIQAKANAGKGSAHTVRINAKSRTIAGWTQAE